jgi:O-antigen ligase/cytochrome c-type biogenesis protein CcmH/NrfG
MPRRDEVIIDPNALFTTSARWESLTLGIVVSLLAFGPAALGAVEGWSALVVLILAAALSLLVALRAVFDRDFAPPRTWLYLPLALFIILIACQLLSMPAGLLAWLSPSTVATKADVLDETRATLGPTTLSFYPLATTELLRLVLAGTAVFVAVATMIRSTNQIKLVLVAIFVIGCAEALLAVAQLATGTGDFYWQIPSGRAVLTSGTFVNYSHFSQFMNLSLGAGIALLLMQFREHGRHEGSSETWRYSLSHLGWEKYGWLFSGMVLCAIAVLASMSRNGAISMLVAAAIVGAALNRRGTVSWTGWILAAIPLAVLTILLIVGFDAIYARLSTLQQSTAYASRWEMTAATLRAWIHYPLWGTGLGTHEYVFPMFDRSVTPVVAAHADNDYAQLLEETGVAGAALVAAFLFGIGQLIYKLVRRKGSSSSVAVFGLAFGLIAVAIHSATDFGQRVPANLCLTATICGLVVALSFHEKASQGSRHRRRSESSPIRPFAPGLGRGVAIAGLVGTVGIGSWAIYGGYWSYIGEQWWSAALELESQIHQNPDEATDQDFADLIAAADGAVQAQPYNVKYGYWLSTYRWESISRAMDAETGEVTLHPDVLTFVARIADELAAVRKICPTYGPPYALEGQLRKFVLDDPRGTDLIRTGAQLASFDPPTCFVAGELAAREGKVGEAERLLTRAVLLKPSYFGEVIQIYLNVLGKPDLARELAGDNYQRLELLAHASARVPELAEFSQEVGIAAVASLRRRAATSTATATELVALARVEMQDGQHETALDLYRRAVNLEYGQVEWRLEFARALADTEKLADALSEVEVCLRLQAENPAAKTLRSELIDKIEKLDSSSE